ncbi:Ger(x)C family spore germination protein [Paenibacillus sp. GCM10023248]|uniref:Ger(x)C family spore germination protein n=1 Tax=Bacillales TaxID=1385 RepID=UPI0023794A5B|nr:MULTISPECIES: Ger(x)C family spore germination protein [Bacillales]MDD9266716.1 Ger(x)C family spore germination protein [Paenibacillus sp. MAHUQ-63]MDR6883662.1 Ger(x)C family germination protein [Bacillus sp. 3255]
MKMGRLVRMAAGLLIIVSQTGCWDIKTIQDTNYLTAIGFDYQKGRYIVYGQMLDFASVAKQEGSKASQPPQIWVGREEGDTVNDAFNKLYKTTQQRVFWGHVSAYLFSSSALKQGIGKFTDGSVRYSETRFTQWIYSTDESIEAIFTIIPFFNVSPMSSILMNPTENYRQRSYIRPFRLYKVAALLREPGYTLMIPTLSIRDDVWTRNQKPDPKLEVNGVYAIGKHERVNWLSESQFTGDRWMERNTARSPLVIYKDNKPIHTLSINKPKARITLHKSDALVFDVHVKCKAVSVEVTENVPEDFLQKQAEKQIAEEIKMTFEQGRKRGVDVYQLEHALYKQDFKSWAKLTLNGTQPLEGYQLGDIQVEVQLRHSGMLKLKDKEPQY